MCVCKFVWELMSRDMKCGSCVWVGLIVKLFLSSVLSRVWLFSRLVVWLVS